MTSSTEANKLGRVVVGFSSSMQNEAALAAGLLVAETTGAEICGLYLEDSRLLEHVAFQFRQGSVEAIQPITHEAMRTALRNEANRWRKRLSVEAEKRHLRWSFEAGQEELSERLPGEIGNDDLFVLIRDSISESLSSRSHQFIGYTGRISSIILGTGPFVATANAPVAAILEEGTSTGPTLEALSTLLHGKNGAVHLILLADEPAQIKDRADKLRAGIGGGHSITVHVAAKGPVTGIVHLINVLKPALTVADTRQSLFEDRAMVTTLIRLANPPFLLVGRDKTTDSKDASTVVSQRSST